MAKEPKEPKLMKSGKQKTKKMTVEQLKAHGVKGAIKHLALTAVKLAGMNNYEGVSGFGQNGAAIAKNDKKARKAASNKIQPKWSPKGSLWNLPETSDTIQTLRGLAKSAAGDLAAREYSASVKSFLEALTTSGGEGGTRTYSAEGIADIASIL